MEILFILIPLSLLLVAVMLWAFGWSVRNGQFDDLQRHGHDLLFDEEPPSPELVVAEEDAPPIASNGERENV